MKLKVITGIMLTLFLTTIPITFLFNVITVKANPGIIRVPQDYEKIQWAVGNASFGDIIWVASGTYYEHVVVNKKVEIIGENRSTTIIDGGGNGEVVLIDASYAKISNFTIQHGENGFLCNWVDGNLIIGNIIRSNSFGVYLTHSKGNTIDGNLLTGNHYGIYITSWSEGNAIIRNTIISCRYTAIITYYAFGNVIIENSVIGNPVGIELGMSSSNKIYHNNFINNEKQVTRSGMDIWDNGYPSGGNYWSDYKGVDEYSGLYQNETGSDGIGDTPYIVQPVYDNKDKYPLMCQYFKIEVHDVAIVNISLSDTGVYPKQIVKVTVFIKNEGTQVETTNVTVYYNGSSLGKQTITNLVPCTLTPLTFNWNTTDVYPGSYTIKAEADVVPDENDTGDNIKIDGVVLILQPTGGTITPINKLELLMPYIGVVSVILVTLTVVVKKKKLMH